MCLLIYLTLLTVVDALFGSNARVAVIDSGVDSKWIVPRHVESWLGDGDDLGHGTAVSGIIASRMPGCVGVASRVTLYSFRAFGLHRRTGHSDWFDAALHKVLWIKPDVLNLSHGDIRADPSVEHMIDRLVQSGITVVASAGNHGTHLSPARLSSVISVGVHNHAYEIGERSAHGWSPTRSIKPDLVAFGIRAASISSLTGTCSRFSGTSYAAPLVTGAIARLVDSHYPRQLNPGHIRQLLYDSATRIPGYTMLQQGFGRLNLTRALLMPIRERLAAYPSEFDLLMDCDYLRPLCDHQLSVGSAPLVFNLTLIDSRWAVTTITGYEWTCPDVFELTIQLPRVLYTYGGELELTIRQISRAGLIHYKTSIGCTLRLRSDGHYDSITSVRFLLTANK